MVYDQDDDDELDGLCDEDSQPEPVPDEDIDGIVLFADVNPNDKAAVELREQEYEQLFGGLDGS